MEKPIAKTQEISRIDGDIWVDGGTLRVIAGPDKGAFVEVVEEAILVGRAEGCALRLSDGQVSAVHLELRPASNGVIVRDLQTTNGTRIGELGIHEVRLADGSEMAIGQTTLRFEYRESATRVRQDSRATVHGLVGQSGAMRALYAQIAKVAPTRLSILISGETGTGKELVARAIHEESGRTGPLVVVDCGALVGTLLESTLFGHEKGAFSGASNLQIGLLESADQGTVFLDELGELPLEAQSRLLRVLEARTIRRVGGQREIPIDVRVVSATHRDLPAMVAAGTFRADLFFRLAGARLAIPALRERAEDIPALAKALLARLQPDDVPSISPEAMEVLMRRDFPGNVRELRNTLEVATAYCSGGTIAVEDVARRADLDRGTPLSVLPPAAASRPSMDLTSKDGLLIYREAKEAALAEFENYYLARLLELSGRNLTHAAARAGLERHHLRSLLRKRGLWRESK